MESDSDEKLNTLNKTFNKMGNKKPIEIPVLNI